MDTKKRNNMNVYVRVMNDVVKGAIQDLAETLDEKDKNTFLHCRRVLDMCILVGFRLRLSIQEIEDLALAAFLHDVGKIGVPDKILKKPGALTGEETEVMRTHPRVSAGVLSAAGGSRESVKAVACHHERYDGKGYPYGLKGENIPLLSKIISVADAYDSMTSKRVYADAVDKKEAILRLVSCSGTQFDPGITDIFIERVKTSRVYLLEAI